MTGTPDGHNLRALLIDARDRFIAAEIPSPAADARILARTALERTDGGTYELVETVSGEFAELFESWVGRREAREPLQLITGEAPFGPLTLTTAPGVFIPRPETELLALAAAEAAEREAAEATVVDLGTGTGAIALFIAHHLTVRNKPGRVYAVEIDEAAAQLARENAARAGLDINVVQADAATALPELDGQCDVVATNPPYIPPDAIPRDVEVRLWDPDRALYGGGADGLEVPRALIRRAKNLLKPGGMFLIEHSDLQAEAVRRLLNEAGGFTMVESHRDLAGRDRYVTALRDTDLPRGRQ